MKRKSQAFVAAVAIAASLCLTGCELPDFVFLYCEDALLPAAGKACMDGLKSVETHCRKVHTIVSQINQCTYEGQKALSLTRDKYLGNFVAECAKSVNRTVCTEGSGCHEEPNKITPFQTPVAVDDFVTSHKYSLEASITVSVEVRIAQITTLQYSTKVHHEAVPFVVQAQCENLIMVRLGQEDVSLSPAQKIWEICSKRGAKIDRGWRWIDHCQNSRLQDVYEARRQMIKEFKDSCARVALAHQCFKGSVCANDVNEADLIQSHQYVAEFMQRHLAVWVINLEMGLMRLTESTHWYSRVEFFDEFTYVVFQHRHLLALITIAVLGCVSCIVAVLRFARKGTDPRSFRTVDALAPAGVDSA